MKKYFILWLGLGLFTTGFAQQFDAFLQRIQRLPDSLKQASADSYLQKLPGYPWIEQETVAHFLLRKSATSVTIPGDANGWDPQAFNMRRITNTNWWYYTQIFEPDARLDYKFVLNGTNWILDPKNPYQVAGGFGPNSELRMPAYQPAPEINFYPDIPHGTIFDTTFASVNLGNSRRIRIYVPPGYPAQIDSLGLILFHDGLEYISLAQSERVLDYLLSKGEIQPVLGVFVPPINRTAEYAGHLKTQFTNFIVNELLPWLNSRYRIYRAANWHATLGASNGGNIALHLGWKHPEIFGNIAAQSSNVEQEISAGFQTQPRRQQKFYLDIGTYDIQVLIPLVRNLRQVLIAKEYPLHYAEFHEGHSWGNWRAHIDEALKFFFPKVTTIPNSDPIPLVRFNLEQNYPNPFNPTTTIVYSLTESTTVELTIFNQLGQSIKTLLQEMQAPGQYSVQWDGADAQGRKVGAGIYYYQLIIGAQPLVKKMVLVK
ncbi:T9SS type A sorting domain-containing protein [candidate division KSB1 bacterium]|nr:T9SS type A sorting domain-containing protein [candidate division KSB1 bacterium]